MMKVVSLARAQQTLGVSRVTLYRWLKRRIHRRRTAHCRGTVAYPDNRLNFVIGSPRKSQTGWVNLEQAARALGVARQTVLHKVQRGELEAMRVGQRTEKRPAYQREVGARVELPGWVRRPKRARLRRVAAIDRSRPSTSASTGPGSVPPVPSAGPWPWPRRLRLPHADRADGAANPSASSRTPAGSRGR